MSLMHPADDPMILRAARAIVLLAVMSILLLASAEQGGIGSELSPVPERPLPFDRSKVFGVDLTAMGSAGALAWLEAAQPSPFALVHLPVDAEIVGALAADDTRESALTALDQLIQASGDAPVAVCLAHPLSPLDDPMLAEVAIDALRDRYAGTVAYISSCDTSDSGNWLEALVEQLPDETIPSRAMLLPLTTGAPIAVEQIPATDDLRTANLRSFSGSDYVAPRLAMAQPPSEVDIALATDALQNAAQIGLVLLQPGPGVEPWTFVRPLVDLRLSGPFLPEGFSNVGSPSIQLDSEWQSARVGTVEYRRGGPGAAMSATFVGTTIYLMGLLSPEAGTVAVWIDGSEEEGNSPDAVVDLSVDQAQDGAIVLADDLAAAEHTLQLVTRDGEAVISGLFVSGEPESGWSAGSATLALILAGTAALALIGYSRARRIRRRTGPQADDDDSGYHPREFTRAG